MQSQRELIRRRAIDDFDGWACSECEWRFPCPASVLLLFDPNMDALADFNSHDCEEYPRIWERLRVAERAKR